MMRQRIGNTFGLSRPERETLIYLCEFLPGSADTGEICGRLTEVTDNDEEREAILTLLYRVAPGDSEAVTPQQDALIANISRNLNIPSERFNIIRKASVPNENRQSFEHSHYNNTW